MHKKPLKVALLWPRHTGSITSVNDVARMLDREKFSVLFICISGKGNGRLYEQEEGFEVYYLSPSQHSEGFRLSSLRRLIKILKEQKVDILHCHRHKPTVYGTIAAMFAGVPVVLSQVHGLNRTRNLGRKLVNFILLRRVKKIICVAGLVKEDIIKSNWSVNPDKLVVLENSVDYERFAGADISKEHSKRLMGAPEDSFVFATVGRLAPTKGLSYLISAFGKIRNKLPNANLVIIGEGPDRDGLERQAQDTGYGDSIRFPGCRFDVDKLYKGMDVFVLSSIAEGMPRALMEAMAAGVPCISTDVGGIPEIFDNGDAGRLVPPKDADALAQAMSALAELSDDERQCLAGKARERIKNNYSHRVVCEKLAQLYDSQIETCSQNCET